MRPRLLFLIALVALSSAVRAQQTARAVVEGVVRTPDGRPVQSGVITFGDTSSMFDKRPYVPVDSGGTFSLTVPAGSDSLRFYSPYYEEVQRALTLAPGDTVRTVIETALRPRYRAPFVAPDTTDQVLYLRSREAAARALGLYPLRTTDLPSGTREIRLSADGALGFERRFVQLVESGGRITGRVIMYALVEGGEEEAPPHEQTAAQMRYRMDPRCDSIHTLPIEPATDAARWHHTAVLACIAEFREEPDWAGLWAAMSALDVWTLPDDSVFPEDEPWGDVVLDGWALQVETRDGPSYRTYSYANPDPENPVWEQLRQANALAALLHHAVYARLRPEGGYGHYRGHAITMSDRDTDAALFFPCGGGGPWQTYTPREVTKRLHDVRILFLDGEGYLTIPGRHSASGPMHPGDEPEPEEPVFERWLYLGFAEGADLRATAPRPGDCAAP